MWGFILIPVPLSSSLLLLLSLLQVSGQIEFSCCLEYIQRLPVLFRPGARPVHIKTPFPVIRHLECEVSPSLKRSEVEDMKSSSTFSRWHQSQLHSADDCCRSACSVEQCRGSLNTWESSFSLKYSCRWVRFLMDRELVCYTYVELKACPVCSGQSSPVYCRLASACGGHPC